MMFYILALFSFVTLVFGFPAAESNQPIDGISLIPAPGLSRRADAGVLVKRDDVPYQCSSERLELCEASCDHNVLKWSCFAPQATTEREINQLTCGNTICIPRWNSDITNKPLKGCGALAACIGKQYTASYIGNTESRECYEMWGGNDGQTLRISMVIFDQADYDRNVYTPIDIHQVEVYYIRGVPRNVPGAGLIQRVGPPDIANGQWFSKPFVWKGALQVCLSLDFYTKPVQAFSALVSYP